MGQHMQKSSCLICFFQTVASSYILPENVISSNFTCNAIQLNGRVKKLKFVPGDDWKIKSQHELCAILFYFFKQFTKSWSFIRTLNRCIMAWLRNFILPLCAQQIRCGNRGREGRRKKEKDLTTWRTFLEESFSWTAYAAQLFVDFLWRLSTIFYHAKGTFFGQTLKNFLLHTHTHAHTKLDTKSAETGMGWDR